MSVNLTKIRARINDVKRKIYYDENTTLKLLDIQDTLLEIKSGWFLVPTVTSNRAIGAEYWDMYIVDGSESCEGPYDLDLTLKIATQVEVDGERYKIFQYTRPRGVTKMWYLRLESTGEFS